MVSNDPHGERSMSYVPMVSNDPHGERSTSYVPSVSNDPDGERSTNHVPMVSGLTQENERREEPPPPHIDGSKSPSLSQLDTDGDAVLPNEKPINDMPPEKAVPTVPIIVSHPRQASGADSTADTQCLLVG
jgi:hypothetical protein